MNGYENIEREPKLPYGGLFGESNLIKVIEQVIADPDIEYRPIDLEMLTKESAPTVRASLKALTSLGLLEKDETDRQHPVYRVNIESKRYIALTFLAYAVLDDKNGTDSMNKVIADYIESTLGEFSRPVDGHIGATNLELAIQEQNSREKAFPFRVLTGIQETKDIACAMIVHHPLAGQVLSPDQHGG